MFRMTEDGDDRWWRFWSRSAWRTWWARREPWREYRRVARTLGPDAAVSAPPRPISPAWVPVSILALVTVLTPGAEPAAPAAAEVTTTTTSLPVATVTTDSGSTTTITNPTTTVPSTSSTSSSSSTTTTTVPDDPVVVGPSGDPSAPPPPGAEMVTVTEITDGDTIRVRRGHDVEPLRLFGINSPEPGECFAAESAWALAALTPMGSQVAVTVDVNDRDDFGRVHQLPEPPALALRRPEPTVGLELPSHELGAH